MGYVLFVGNCTKFQPDENFYLEMISGNLNNNISVSLKYFDELIYIIYTPSRFLSEFGFSLVILSRVQSILLSAISLFLILIIGAVNQYLEIY